MSDAVTQPRFEEDYLHMLMFLPEKINRCINLLAEEYITDATLKVYYLPYIIHIHEIDGISQKKLKELIPFDKSRISVVVHELLDKNLVYDDGVGRNSSLHLTEAGHASYAVYRDFIGIVKKEVFGFNPEEEAEIKRKQVEFNDRLDKIIQNHAKE